jgi:hypothetical protein
MRFRQGNLPDLTALGAFQSKEACVSAAHDVEKALGSGEYPKTLVCLGSDSLNKIASDNGVGQ